MTTYRTGEDPDGGDQERDHALTEAEWVARGLPTKLAPTCRRCGSILSSVTWECVRGVHCQPARAVAGGRR